MLKWLMLFVYFIVGVYVLHRIIYWFKIVTPLFKHRGVQGICVALYCIAASMIFFGAFLPSGRIQTSVHRAGNVWLGFLIYLLTYIAASDIIVLILKLINKKKEIPILKKRYGTLIIGAAVTVSSFGFTIYGTIHARNMTTKEYDVGIEKHVDGLDGLNVVLVADLHLGYSIGCKDMEKMVKRINALNPDVVIYAGDIFDNDYDALDDSDRLSQIISGVNAKYGSYAVFGNHDVTETLVGGFSVSSAYRAFRDDRMEPFLESAGINVLLDDVIQIADGKINLVGRLDEEKPGDGTKNRKPLDELLSECDMNKPVIVINHEPDKLCQNAQSGVDVLLSGHTHAGQFFPLTVVQPFAWENYYGVKKIDNMYSVVTSGIGVYGPAIRVGTDSEVTKINIYFK